MNSGSWQCLAAAEHLSWKIDRSSLGYGESIGEAPIAAREARALPKGDALRTTHI